MLFCGQLKSLNTIDCLKDLESLIRQFVGKHLPQCGIVFNDQNVFFIFFSHCEASFLYTQIIPFFLSVIIISCFYSSASSRPPPLPPPLGGGVATVLCGR